MPKRKFKYTCPDCGATHDVEVPPLTREEFNEKHREDMANRRAKDPAYGRRKKTG